MRCDSPGGDVVRLFLKLAEEYNRLGGNSEGVKYVVIASFKDGSVRGRKFRNKI